VWKRSTALTSHEQKATKNQTNYKTKNKGKIRSVL